MFVTSYQRRKNLGSRVALLPRKFLRVLKVFVGMLEKMSNYQYSFRAVRTAFYMSGLIENFPASFKTVQLFLDGLKSFRTLLKLSRSFQIVSKLSGWFQNCPFFFLRISKSSRRFQKCSDISMWFQNVPEGSKLLCSFRIVSKLSGWFEKCPDLSG